MDDAEKILKNSEQTIKSFLQDIKMRAIDECYLQNIRNGKLNHQEENLTDDKMEKLNIYHRWRQVMCTNTSGINKTKNWAHKNKANTNRKILSAITNNYKREIE